MSPIYTYSLLAFNECSKMAPEMLCVNNNMHDSNKTVLSYFKYTFNEAYNVETFYVLIVFHIASTHPFSFVHFDGTWS